jgi:hypothetical protein
LFVAAALVTALTTVLAATVLDVCSTSIGASTSCPEDHNITTLTIQHKIQNQCTVMARIQRVQKK